MHTPPDIPAPRHYPSHVSDLYKFRPKLIKVRFTYIFSTLVRETNINIQSATTAGEGWVVASAGVAIDNCAAAVSVDWRERRGECR